MTGKARTEILQGTLDLLVLKTLETLGPLHGFGIARRIEQVSGAALQLNQGTLYPALVRLEQRGWIRSSWGVSGRRPPGADLFANEGWAENSSPPKRRAGNGWPP